MSFTNFATGPTLGVDVTAPTSATPDFHPGAKVNTADGGEAIYVLAGAAIAAGDVLQITSTTGSAVGLTTTLAANDTATAGKLIGVAHVAITNGQYGWACLKGIPTAGINVAAACVKGAPLYTTATAGQVDDAATHLIAGMMLTATAVGAAVTPGILSNPVLVRGTVGA